MKNIYQKPTCSVYDIKHRTMILCSSPASTPPDSPDYDDWLGAREFDLDGFEEDFAFDE